MHNYNLYNINPIIMVKKPNTSKDNLLTILSVYCMKILSNAFVNHSIFVTPCLPAYIK